MSSCSAFWAIIQTVPAQERRARDYLSRGGHTVFLPMIEQRVVVRGHLATRIYPLFPGYLFVHLQTINGILGTIGVLRVMSMSGVPSQLPEVFVETLLVALDDEGVMRLPQEPPISEKFKRGQKVFTREGPLELIPGIFDGMTGTRRCRVLYEMLGGQRPVEMDIEQLK